MALKHLPEYELFKLVKEIKDVNALQDIFNALVDTNCHVSIIQWLLDHSLINSHVDNDAAIQNASANGNRDVVLMLLKRGANPAVDDNTPIGVASENGHVDVVQLLLQDDRVDPGADDQYALMHCKKNNIAKLLLQDSRVDPGENDNMVIKKAAKNGAVEIIKMLLKHPKVNPAANHNEAIRNASEYGHVEVVRLLLSDSRVDPSDHNQDAIYIASQQGYKEVVELLLSDSRVSGYWHDRAIKVANDNDHFDLSESLIQSYKKRKLDEPNQAFSKMARIHY